MIFVSALVLVKTVKLWTFFTFIDTFFHYSGFIRILYSLKPSGAGAGILICGSAEPEQKEIFSAPQH